MLKIRLVGSRALLRAEAGQRANLQRGEAILAGDLSDEYPALLARQGFDSPPLALFSASAVDINQWVGIPQKTCTRDVASKSKWSEKDVEARTTKLIDMAMRVFTP
jgi:hypothetical protein